ncbi:hypothetical protein AB0M54_26905 [Actinoplanes sp. NPDC051470]|uniref:hypothetical protein n=1 Tax=Actinoplanes sp. NPDC051470 TaxID=3157224 RepID=UPI00343E0FDF
MLDPETTAVITGAAGNVVAYLLNGQVDAARAWVGRIFRGRGKQEAEPSALQAIEEDAKALAQQLTTEADVKARWVAFMAAYLAENPNARAEITAMAESRPDRADTMFVAKQENQGPGTFVGRDNFGAITPPGVR